MAKTTNTTSKDVYQLVTDRIIAELEKGVIPWQKPWTGTGSGAYSRATGRPYSLLNQMLLKHTGEYLTFKQALDAGGSVRKGEKGETVVFWKMVKVTDQDANGAPEEKLVPFLRYYTVFHISQCDGVEPKHTAEELAKPFDPIQAAEQLAARYAGRENLRIEHEQGNKAYYSPRRDLIHLPLQEQFPEATAYYNTLFHEMAHSTGHHSRLNRFAENEAPAAFGSADYSKEELVAEIGAASLLNLIGAEVAASFKNTVAYIQNWLQVLKNDKRFIISAAGRAEKAVDFIIGEEGLDFTEDPAPQAQSATEDPAPMAAPAATLAPASSARRYNIPLLPAKAQAVTVNANNLIDNLIAQFYDIQQFYREVPRGVYIGYDSPYRAAYNTLHTAERCINALSDVLGLSLDALYRMARIARKWYDRGEWQNCLPDYDADRLLSCLMQQDAHR